jgi:hypothetical protein
MSHTDSELLQNKTGLIIKRMDTNVKVIPISTKLATTLRFLTNEGSYKSFKFSLESI